MTSSVALLLVLAAAAAAFPQFASPPKPVPQVVFRSHMLDDAGQFSSSYAGSDGQQHVESGQLKPTADGKGYALEYKGSYKYTSPEGLPVEVHYTAGKDGFQATGNVIPVAPHAAPAAF